MCCVWAQTIQHSIFKSVNSVVSFVIFVGVAQSAQRIVLIVFVVVDDIRCPFVLYEPRLAHAPNIVQTLRSMQHPIWGVLGVNLRSTDPQHAHIGGWP